MVIPQECTKESYRVYKRKLTFLDGTKSWQILIDLIKFIFEQLDDKSADNQTKNTGNKTRKENSRLNKQQSRSESEDDLRHLPTSCSLSTCAVVAKVEPADSTSGFGPEEKLTHTVVRSNDHMTDHADMIRNLNSKEAHPLPRPDSSGSSEVSALQSDHGCHFVREDDFTNSSSFHHNFISTTKDGGHYSAQYGGPDTSCAEVNSLSCNGSPIVSTNEQMATWYQDRVEPFSHAQTLQTSSNYYPSEPGLTHPGHAIASDAFANQAQCDNRLGYSHYTYSEPGCGATTYFSGYQHRSYAPYDYPKF